MRIRQNISIKVDFYCTLISLNYFYCLPIIIYEFRDNDMCKVEMIRIQSKK